jgi:nucleoside-diphosphate-sugar epimerase
VRSSGPGWTPASKGDARDRTAPDHTTDRPVLPDTCPISWSEPPLDLKRLRFRVADVRDVADLHIRAMAAPEAAGKRYLALADGPTISFLQMAQILRERLGPLAERVPTEEAPGPEPPRLIIHNDRAKQELGWRPRPAETTIVETAESLRDLGLLEKR